MSWNLKILFLSGFLIGFAISVVERFALPIFLQQDLKADPTLIGITIGLAWLAMGIPPMIWRGMTDAHSPVKLYVFGLESGLGMMVGSVGSGIISEIAGFRPLFVISGVLSLASALIILSAIRGYK